MLDVISSQLIDMALTEDLGQPYTDVSVQATFAQHNPVLSTKIISKHSAPIIACGVEVVQAILQRLDEQAQCESLTDEGGVVLPGETWLQLHARAQALLMAERTILNFVRHLSAIATMTRQFVEAVAGTSTQILDTRKTTPGQRQLEKYAVHCGGGVNHRMGLYDAIMIKDTHVDLVGGMDKALMLLPEGDAKRLPTIVEVQSESELEQVLELAAHKVDRVLLDNMTIEQLMRCVHMAHGQVETEASGNLNLQTIRAVAETGVDYASVGMITHSAGNIDLSMKELNA